MPVYAFFIARGLVQSVGYRGLVRREAYRFGIRGVVRNHANGTVEVFVEAPDEKTLLQFRDAINVQLGAPSVEKLEEYREGEKGFRKAWRAYDGFVVDLGSL